MRSILSKKRWLCLGLGAVLAFGLGNANITQHSTAIAQTNPALTELQVGEKAFNVCKSCHTLEKGGADMTGPNLHGLFGKKAGTVSKTYGYSPALKAYGVTWSEATLDTYLQNPQAAAPGAKMTMRGPSDPAKRKALIVYLKAKTK